MANIKLKNTPCHTVGDLPKIRAILPDGTLTKTDLSEVSIHEYIGKTIILNIFPSLDTPTCSVSVRQFNEKAAGLKDTVVLCISADLPFAQKRFCAAENLNNVIPVSAFRHPEFGKQYGLTIVDGPLSGLLSRVVIVANSAGKIIYTQQVEEIADEPDYEKALVAAKNV